MPRPAVKPLCLGIAGGSGSGKSWLAARLSGALDASVTVVCQDWYYKHNGHLSDAEALALNFDHPDAIETALFARQLRQLLQGRPIDAPVYDYASHARLPRTRRVEPADVVIVEGLLVLHPARLRAMMDCSVYIEVPADVRLARRIRRDSVERRVDLNETLRLYEHCVRPMHERFIAPSAEHATWVWRQEEDEKFPDDLVRALRQRLSSRR